LTMDENKDTIGLQALLDEVSRDLDEFRKKHAGDYGVKNVTLWWELEKERLVIRHGPESVVKKPRRVPRLRRMIWFFAGWVTMLVVNTVVRLTVG
jgi:hypothetical protein